MIPVSWTVWSYIISSVRRTPRVRIAQGSGACAFRYSTLRSVQRSWSAWTSTRSVSNYEPCSNPADTLLGTARNALSGSSQEIKKVPGIEFLQETCGQTQLHLLTGIKQRQTSSERLGYLSSTRCGPLPGPMMFDLNATNLSIPVFDASIRPAGK
jgi:hypothetical protein